MLTLRERNLKTMNIVLKIYRARENTLQRDEALEEYEHLIDSGQFEFNDQEVYLTPRIGQSWEDSTVSKLAMQYKPRGLTLQMILSIDDDNEALYNDYGRSAVICYKHNNTALDLLRVPVTGDVFDYTFCSKYSLQVPLEEFLAHINSANNRFSFNHHPLTLSTDIHTFRGTETTFQVLNRIVSALWNKIGTARYYYRASIVLPSKHTDVGSYPVVSREIFHGLPLTAAASKIRDQFEISTGSKTITVDFRSPDRVTIEV